MQVVQCNRSEGKCIEYAVQLSYIVHIIELIYSYKNSKMTGGYRMVLQLSNSDTVIE